MEYMICNLIIFPTVEIQDGCNNVPDFQSIGDIVTNSIPSYLKHEMYNGTYLNAIG